MKKFAALFAFTFLILSEARSQEIRFTFAPDDDLTFVTTSTVVRERDSGGVTQSDEVIAVTRTKINKTTTGWTVLTTPLSVDMTRNGEPVTSSPVMDILSRTAITYELDADGALVAIKGFDSVLSELSAQFSPEVADALAPMLNLEALEARTQAEWEGRIGGFVGNEVVVGDIFEGDSPFELPNGKSIVFQTTTTIEGTEPCGGTTCVRIKQVYTTDATEAGKLANAVVNEVSKQAAPGASLPEMDAMSGSISGQLTRLIDATTMLIYAEQSERTIEFVTGFSGSEPETSKMVESRVYEYEY